MKYLRYNSRTFLWLIKASYLWSYIELKQTLIVYNCLMWNLMKKKKTVLSYEYLRQNWSRSFWNFSWYNCKSARKSSLDFIQMQKQVKIYNPLFHFPFLILFSWLSFSTPPSYICLLWNLLPRSIVHSLLS